MSLVSFVYFFSNGMTNNYGDGVAHVNIARKVVDSPDDSLWQRYIQIGSPWLPAQTVLMLPLVWSDSLWRTGAAGSIISMVSFVAAAVMLFLIASRCYGEPDGLWGSALPLLAAGILVLNPSTIYLQTTPMSELLFMAALGGSVLALQNWFDNPTRKRLVIAGLIFSIATLTRYEAWPVVAIAVLIVVLCSSGDVRVRAINGILFLLVAMIGPVYWLWHNWAIYGNALEFLTGSSSARGLYQQNRASLGWSQVFVGNAALDIVLMLTAVSVCCGPVLVLAAFAGMAKAGLRLRALRRRAPLFLLAVPFFFHVLSVYRGEIQIFPLSVFGLLNARYGLPHLPGVALTVPAVALLFRPEWRARVVVILAVLAGLQYWHLWSDGADQLAVFQEGYRNGVNSRSARDLDRTAKFLSSEPPAGMVLMQSGSLGPLVPRGGLRFGQVIHEGTARWHQVEDAIPVDVSAVILETGDVLDQRIRGNPALDKQLNEAFSEEFNAGKIKVFIRRRASHSES